MAKPNTIARESQSEFIQNVPVFINVRDRLSCLVQLTEWLERAGHRNIILIDNASTYPPLVQFLNSTKHRTIRLKKNIGHTALWRIPETRKVILKQWYIYTDPDVIPTEHCPIDAAAYLRDLLERFPEYLKAGLGLKIDDLPDHYHLKEEVLRWETALLGRELLPGVVQADVDTTFALHRPGTPYTIGPALRTQGLYEARHLPWYVDSQQVDTEESYYREHALPTVSNWNTDGGMRLVHDPDAGVTKRMERDPQGLLDEILNSRVGRSMALLQKVRHPRSVFTRGQRSYNGDRLVYSRAIVQTLTSQEWSMALRLTKQLSTVKQTLRGFVRR